MKQTAFLSQFRQALVHLRSSLWFIPTLLIIGAVVLALSLVELDLRVDGDLRQWWPRVFAMEAEGARTMLSAIASSMATIAGVTFSITMVALTLASTQYSSRVLRNFMRDRANQVVLGVFVGIYIYCLIVIRTISSNGGGLVPAVAVLTGLGLAVIAIGFFIFFIHHVSASIQASEIIAAITRETRDALGLLFPERLPGGEEQGDPSLGDGGRRSWHPIAARRFGYIQRVAPGELVQFAEELGGVVRMEVEVGAFVMPGQALVSIAVEKAPADSVQQRIDRLFSISSYRTVEQDPAFGIRQLVDIALKALSPSVNDTTTAVTCIEHLALLLAECACRCPTRIYRADDGKVRLMTMCPNFDRLVSLAFAQILENAEGNTEILIRVLQALTRIAERSTSKSRLATLERWADVVAQIGQRTAKSDEAVRLIEQRLADAGNIFSRLLATAAHEN